MKKLKFHFYSSNQIGGLLIRFRTGSEFSHVGIEFEDGSFFDATMTHGTGFHELRKGAVEVIEVSVTNARYEEVLSLAKDMDGTAYDWKAILGFVLNTKTQNKNLEFCSEVGRIFFEVGIGQTFKHYKLVSPGRLRYLLMGYNAGRGNRK